MITKPNVGKTITFEAFEGGAPILDENETHVYVEHPEYNGWIPKSAITEWGTTLQEELEG